VTTPTTQAVTPSLNDLARQAGLPMSWLDKGTSTTWPELERFAELAIAQSRAQDAATVADGELEIAQHVVERLSTILARIAIAVNGPPEPLHSHSYHDLAEKVEKALLELAVYRELATPAAQGDGREADSGSVHVDSGASCGVQGAEPPLTGRWHHGQGHLVSGSIRISRWDCDTNPPVEFRDKLLDWMCDTLNAAVASWEANTPDEFSIANEKGPT
jgi:hypothetical protein